MNQPTPASHRFDSNRAWQEASGSVSANRDVLIALAGVFMAVPAFALAVLVTPPEPEAGADLDAMIKLAEVYFREAWPALLLASLATTLGTMAMLTLFGHAGRPTVGEAIRHGLVTTPIALLTQIIQGFLLTGLVMLPTMIAGISGSQGITVIGTLIGIGLAARFWTRTSLANPVIAVESQRNPLAALRRSFALTRGNAARLLLFFALLVLAFVIAGQLLQLALSLLAQALGGADAGRIAGAFSGAVVQSAMGVYLAAAMAASHAQLAWAGTSPFANEG